jgi:hypothetical protein
MCKIRLQNDFSENATLSPPQCGDLSKVSKIENRVFA